MSKSAKLDIEFVHPLSDDPELSYTLPSRYYTDPEIFELEKERIFQRSWAYVCHISQVQEPGAYASVNIAGEPVFVVRNRAGELNAFYNVCQHRGHELVEGSGKLNSLIVCPYHAWAYGYDGALVRARSCETVKAFDKSDFGLKPVRLEEFANLVFVNLDQDAVPLCEQAPNLEADIRENLPYWDDVVLTDEYGFGGDSIAAGWKVVVDNYAECYHCEPAHPAFSDLICMPEYEHTIDGITARQKGHEIRYDNSAYPIEEDAAMPHSLFWYIWPNTTINILPGKGDMMIGVIEPISPTQTRFASYRFSPDGEHDDPVRQDYVANVLGNEDRKLCESVQRGLSSKGYDQGRLVVDSERKGTGEHVIHWFHTLVRDALA